MRVYTGNSGDGASGMGQLPNLVYVTLRQKRLADEPDLTAEQQ